MLATNPDLIFDESTTPQTPYGYIFNFRDKGSFAPNGRTKPLTDTQISAHNTALADLEISILKETGRGIFYVSRDATNHPNGARPTRYYVGPWTDSKRFTAFGKTGAHNIARTRLDLWFTIDGARYWGVNIGDNDIVRCKRIK